MDIVTHDAEDDEFLPASGTYGLWLRVTSLAVTYFLEYQSALARDFIFDEDNIFFDFVCEQMGYEPGQIRRQLLKAISKRTELKTLEVSKERDI